MNILYSGQKKWARGKTPEEATGYLKKFLKGENVNIDFDKCLSDKIIEDYILNDRIEGVKKFKVNATPTIIINDKKFEKSLNYKNLKKYLEKLI
jgi:protein-disulfide isomerase